jgi:hypothetical protein
LLSSPGSPACHDQRYSGVGRLQQISDLVKFGLDDVFGTPKEVTTVHGYVCSIAPYFNQVAWMTASNIACLSLGRGNGNPWS